jgi:hypothetical protein
VADALYLGVKNDEGRNEGDIGRAFRLKKRARHNIARDIVRRKLDSNKKE